MAADPLRNVFELEIAWQQVNPVEFSASCGIEPGISNLIVAPQIGSMATQLQLARKRAVIQLVVEVLLEPLLLSG